MKYVWFFPMAMAVGIILLPVTDMKSKTLSFAVNLLFSNPEIET